MHVKSSGIQFIFSVERPERSAKVNLFLTNSVNVCLRNAGFPFKQVQGVFKNKKEQSFFILPLEARHSIKVARNYVERLCSLYDQESYLEIKGRDAYLKQIGTLDDKKKTAYQFIGQWRTVDKTTARKNKNYTFDPYTGFYHIAV